jgi:DNA-binding protein HU-beta
MNKTELIDRMAAEASITKTAASTAYDAMIDGIITSLKQGDPVVLTGFGRFHVRERAARKGHNPKTGKSIDIKAAKVPGFKAGKMLKDAIQDTGR